MSTYIAYSSHINVQQGDAAVHDLVKGGKDGELISRVLVDAGRGSSNQSLLALEDFIKAYKAQFHAVVITHWDSDHYLGLYKLLDAEWAKAKPPATWQPSCFYFDETTGEPITRFYCPYFGDNKPKGMGDLKNSYMNFVSQEEGAGANKYYSVRLKSGSAVSLPIARLYSTNNIGANFFNYVDNPPTLDQAKTFTTPKALVDWHGANSSWTKEYPGAPGLYCVAQNWTYIGRGPGFTVMGTIDSTYTNQSSMAAMLIWPDGQMSLYTAGDRDDKREVYIVDGWSGCTGDPGATQHVTTIKVGHHGAATSTPKSMLDKFNPENIIISAGTDYGHPRYELIEFMEGWNKKNKSVRVRKPGSTEYRDFDMPVVSTVFPYWIAKDKSDNWVVLPLNKMSTLPMDDDNFEEFRTNIEAYYANINDAIKQLKPGDPGYGTSAMVLDPVTQYQMAYGSGADRYDKIQGICGAASLQWTSLSKIGSQLYPVMSAKGYMYDGNAQVDKPARNSVLFIEVTHQSPFYQDGSVKLYYLDLTTELLRDNSSRMDPTFLVAAAKPKPERVEAPGPPFPILSGKPRGRFPSEGLVLTTDDLYINPDNDPDEATEPMPSSGKPAALLPVPPFPDVSWPQGNYFFSQGGMKPQGPLINATECATSSSFGYFLLDLHMRLIGLTSTPDPHGWYSVLDEDELPGWFTEVMEPPLGSPALLQVTMDSPTATKFNDMQLTVSSLFGGSLVFNASSVAAAFPQGITPLMGVVVDESMLVLGLDPANSSAKISTTTSDLFKYLSLPRKLPFVLSLDLEPSKSDGKRNAVWFVPGLRYATSFRSVWTAEGDGIADLNTFLGKFGLGINVTMAEVIAVKKVMWALPDRDYASSATLGITVTVSGKPLSAYLELKAFGTNLIVTCGGDDGPSLEDIVNWVVEPFKGSVSNDVPPTGAEVRTLLSQLAKDIKPRQMQVSLDGNDALVHCEVSFEVDLNIGQPQGADSKTVASLFTFSWNSKSGLRLAGSFFPAAPPLPFANDKPLIPGYEEYRDLKPEAKDAVSSILLMYLVPNTNITEIPGSVQPAIQAASFSIAKDELSFYATITTEEAPSKDDPSPVPHLRLGLLTLGAKHSASTGLSLQCDVSISLTGKDGANSPQALLLGSLVYMRTDHAQRTLARRGMLRDTDSESSWQVMAGIQQLQVGTLYELFDADSQDGVLGLIGHIEIASLDFVYNYSSSKATDFTFQGVLLLGPLELEVDYHYPSTKQWKFHASLTEQPGVSVTLNQLIQDLQSADSAGVDLPGFVGDVALTAGNTSLTFTAQNSMIGANPTVFVTVDLKIGDFEVSFVQFQEKGEAKPKRLFRAAVTGLGTVDNVPIIDRISQPFDDMYFLYVADANEDAQGITKAELDAVNSLLSANSPPLVVKQTNKNPTPADVLIKPGAHFVVASTVNNVPTAVLDYEFTPDKPVPPEPTAEEPRAVAADQPDPGSGQATLKKTIGPLTINNIGLQYKNGSLGILLDATFKLGPIELELVGFSLMVPLAGFTINSVLIPQVSLNGLVVFFNEPPTTMAGMFARLSSALYVGGLTVSMDPYVLTAAGAYGTITDAAGNTYKTVAVFAQLQGPLLELEFVEVTGMTLGFGYNSHMTLPTVDTVTSFPLVGPKPVPSGSAIDIFNDLQTPSPPAPHPPWIVPQSGSIWLAAGLNATALSVLTVSALVTLEFSSSSPTLGLYASAVSQFPTTTPAILYAELGLAGTLDLSAGTLLVQSSLAPASYILDPSCHLTGGFALGYWFAPSSHAGDFVFTLGGYHPAYTPAAHYPTPPPQRLGISWSLDGCLSITGGSYMAVTPKAAMVGSAWHAALGLGPLGASFDAWADFLVNFQPFWFQGEGGVAVRVEFTLDLWIVTIHIDVEIGANLRVWGPSMAGTVHVDFWVFGFDINFGSSGNKPDAPLPVADFYKKVLLQNRDDGRLLGATNQHTVTCVAGLVPSAKGTTETPPAARWDVRGGVFAFSVKSVFPFTHAAVDQGGQVPVPPDVVNPVYSKPMWRTKDEPLETTVAISIFEGQEGAPGTETIPGFRLAGNVAEMPTAIWGDYSIDTDPMRSAAGNQIQPLLHPDDPTVPLLTGLTVTAPKPFYSTDIIPPFNVLLSNIDVVNDCAVFDVYNAPHCDGPWVPVQVVDPVAQYGLVEKTWLDPGAGPGAAQQAVTMWASLWAGPGQAAPEMLGLPPVGMLGVNKGVFEMDYLEAPTVSVGA